MKTTKGKNTKCKVVPIHVMKTSGGGRRRYTPFILNLGLMQISGQHHAKTALLPGNNTGTEAGWAPKPVSPNSSVKSLTLAQFRTPIVQLVA
jgi:hypothetical protein